MAHPQSSSSRLENDAFKLHTNKMAKRKEIQDEDKREPESMESSSEESSSEDVFRIPHIMFNSRSLNVVGHGYVGRRI